MTTFLKGGSDFPIPTETNTVVEFPDGTWVEFGRQGNKIFMACRLWGEDGKTHYTEPVLVSTEPVAVTAQVFAWLGVKGNIEIKVGGQHWYVDPKKIDELPGPPPPPPAPDPIPDCEMHGLSLFEWLLWKAWDKSDVRQEYLGYLRETLREARQHRVNLIDFFLFVSDSWGEHTHVNNRTPYVFRDGKFDLTAKNPQFFGLFEDTLQVFKDEGVRPMPQLFMGFGYNSGPFMNNHQGIRTQTIYDPITWKYTLPVAEWVCESFRKVFGADYRPDIKIVNEAAHSGDAQGFHDLMRWHKEMWEKVLSKYTTLDRIVADISHSEATRGELVGPRYDCPKPGETCYSADFKHGNDAYGRVSWPEDHGMATIQDFKAPPEGYSGHSIIDVVLGSGNICWRPTEDGGSRTKTGQGETFGPYVFATAAQTYEAAKCFWTRARDVNKRIRYALFPIETLDKATGKPDYRKEAIHWNRFAELRRAWEEVYKR